MKYFGAAAVVALGLALANATPSQAGGYYGRQYYSDWNYSYSNGYYYCNYNYKPYYSYPTYNYNYCIYYPSQPSYCYYYNPYKNVYWGRFDVEKHKYSLLADKDRASLLKDIPESAFPEPGPMPAIPDSKDNVAIAEPKDLPKGEPPASPVAKRADKRLADLAGDGADGVKPPEGTKPIVEPAVLPSPGGKPDVGDPGPIVPDKPKTGATDGVVPAGPTSGTTPPPGPGGATPPVPGGGAPTVAPGGAAPGGTVPGGTAPGGAVPGATGPGAVAPGGTAPGGPGGALPLPADRPGQLPCGKSCHPGH